MEKVHIKTYGCQMNDYDSKQMVNVLHRAYGTTETAAPEEADIILLNTCSIREKAQEKVFSELGRLRKFKTKNPRLLIGVGGCVASQEGEWLRERAPYVDLVFGPQTLHRLPKMIEEVREHRKAVVDIQFPEIEKFDCLPTPRADGPKAFVSIMEGCSKYCSYCIVPFTRGAEISRPFDDVIAEVATLAEQGVREITLLGQNVNDYQGPKHDGTTADLGLLIHYVAEIEGIERIRFTTSHPWAFSDSLIDAYAHVPKLVNQLHLPVQSGSNRILQMMKRHYTIEQYERKLDKLRAVRPDISITTDIIVGFPTESDEDFEATMALSARVPFDHSFSFIYSPRPGTPAARLVDNIPMEVKKDRLKRLQALLKTQGDAFTQAMVDTKATILVEGPSKKNPHTYQGRTGNNRIVHFPCEQNLTGQLIAVRLTKALPNCMLGEATH